MIGELKIGTIKVDYPLTCDICGKEGTLNNPVRRYILYKEGE